MAQSGYTPILIYASGTAAALPSAANLTSSANGAELALNYADGKLYYKNSSGVVTLLANAATAAGSPPGGSTTQVQYNNAGAFGGSANFVWDNSNVRLGIGTSSPSQELEVRRDQGSGTLVQVTNKTNNNSATAGVLFENSTSNTASLALWDSGAIAGTVYSDSYGFYLVHSGGPIGIVAQNASGVIKFATGGTTERMRIDSAGVLTAAAASTVASNWPTGTSQIFKLNGATYAGVSFGDPERAGAANRAAVSITAWSGSGSNYYTSKLTTLGDGTLAFSTQATASTDAAGTSTERMRITSDGQLIVGTTATGTGANSARIYGYANNSTHNGAAIYGYNASATYPGVGTTRYGVRGETYGYSSGSNYGVYGYAVDTSVYDTNLYGVYGESGPAIYKTGYGVYAKATHNPGASQSGYALFANMNTTGAGSAATTYGARIENNSTAGQTAFGLYVYSATGATTTVPFAVAVGGSEVMRVNSSGNVGIGTSSPGSKLTVNGGFAASTATLTAATGIYNNGFQAYDQYNPIDFYIAYNSVSTYFQIWGGSGSKLWFTTGSQTLLPSVDGGIPLGTSSNRWGQIYSTNGSINTSDIREKEQISDLDDAEKRVAIRVKSLLKKFKFKSAVQEKGEAARIHFGVMAQEVLAAFEAEGLDAHRYGLFCFDEKWVTFKEVEDKKTGEMLIETVAAKEGDEGAVLQDRYGIRYDELFAFVIAAL